MNRRRGRERGLTFISVLVLLALAGGVWWLATFGPAYWDNQEVKATLREAANLCYHEKDDAKVRAFILRKIEAQFPGGSAKQKLSIDFDPTDLRIERSDTPKRVDIWLTYSRVVKTPFVDQERNVTFVDHADQDLSDLKW